MHRRRLNSLVLVFAVTLAAALPGVASATEETRAHWDEAPNLGYLAGPIGGGDSSGESEHHPAVSREAPPAVLALTWL